MSFGFSPYLSAAQLSSIGSSLAPGAYPSYSAHPPLAVTGGIFGIYNDSGDRMTIVTDDATLSGDASTTIPSEHAVKTYVDTRVFSVPLLLSATEPYQLFLQHGVERASFGCDGEGNFNLIGLVLNFNTDMPTTITTTGTQLTIGDGTDTTTFVTSNGDNRTTINTSVDELRLTSGNNVHIPMTTAASSIPSGALQCDGGASFDGKVFSRAVTINNDVNPILTLKKGAVEVPIGLNGSNEIYLQDTLTIDDPNPQLKFINSVTGEDARLACSFNSVQVESGLLILNRDGGPLRYMRFDPGSTGNMVVSTRDLSDCTWNNIPHIYSHYNQMPELRLKNSSLGSSATLKHNASGEIEIDTTVFINGTNPQMKFHNIAGDTGEITLTGSGTSLGIDAVTIEDAFNIQSDSYQSFFQYDGSKMRVSHNSSGVSAWEWWDIVHEFKRKPTESGRNLISEAALASTLTISGAVSSSITAQLRERDDIVFLNLTEDKVLTTTTGEWIKIAIPSDYRPSVDRYGVYTYNRGGLAPCGHFRMLTTGELRLYDSPFSSFPPSATVTLFSQTLMWYL